MSIGSFSEVEQIVQPILSKQLMGEKASSPDMQEWNSSETNDHVVDM